MANRLPVLKILGVAFYYLFHFRKALLKGLVVPVLICLAVMAATAVVTGILPIALALVMNLLMILLNFSLLAISCHRIFLGRVPETSNGWVVFQLRDFRFMLRLALLWLIAMVIMLPIMMPLAFSDLPWLGLIGAIPSAYVFGRMSPSLPAAAVGDATTMAEAWDLARGNGWRLVVLVVFLPFATSWLTALVMPADASMIMSYLFLPVFLTVFVFEACVLSLAYRALCEAAAPEGAESEPAQPV